MEEGPTRTDETVMNTRTSAKEKILRKCGCGWEKTTTLGDFTSTWERQSAVVVAICNLALPRKGQVRQMGSEAR